MLQKVIGFHLDNEGHWVADLACGHGRHMRHTPPFLNRLWVTTPEGRAAFIGHELDCRRCNEPPIEPLTR